MAVSQSDVEIEINPGPWLQIDYVRHSPDWIERYLRITQWSERYSCGFIDPNNPESKKKFDAMFKQAVATKSVTATKQNLHKEHLWWYAENKRVITSSGDKRVDALIAFGITRGGTLNIHAGYGYLRDDVSKSTKEYVYMVFFGIFTAGVPISEDGRRTTIRDFYLVKGASTQTARLQKILLEGSFNFVANHKNTGSFGSTAGRRSKPGFFDTERTYNNLRYKYPTSNSELVEALRFGSLGGVDLPRMSARVKDLDDEPTMFDADTSEDSSSSESSYVDANFRSDPTKIMWTMTIGTSSFKTVTKLELYPDACVFREGNFFDYRGQICKNRREGTILFSRPAPPYGRIANGDLGFFYYVVLKTLMLLFRTSHWSDDFAYFACDEDYPIYEKRFFRDYLNFSEDVAKDLRTKHGVLSDGAVFVAECSLSEPLAKFVEMRNIYENMGASEEFGKQLASLIDRTPPEGSYHVVSLRGDETEVLSSIKRFFKASRAEIETGNAINIVPDPEKDPLVVGGGYRGVRADFFSNSATEKNAITLFAFTKNGVAVAMATFRFYNPREITLIHQVDEFVQKHATYAPNVMEVKALYTMVAHRGKGLANYLLYSAISTVMKHGDKFKVGWMVSESVSPAATTLLTKHFGFNVLIQPNKEGKIYGLYDEEFPRPGEWTFEEPPLALILDEAYGQKWGFHGEDVNNEYGWNLGVDMADEKFIRAMETQREKLKECGFKFQGEAIRKKREEGTSEKRRKARELLELHDDAQ